MRATERTNISVWAVHFDFFAKMDSVIDDPFRLLSPPPSFNGLRKT